MNHQHRPAASNAGAAFLRKHPARLAAGIALALAGSAALPAIAGVQVMSSDEMVETYVKDSAVIVVPKENRKTEADRKRIIRALTISPGEPVITEAEEEAYREASQRLTEEGRSDALANAEEEFLRRALLLPQEELARAQPPAEFTPNIPPLIFGQQMQIPDEPFTQTFLNDQLGIGFDGQNVNFSIGNPPGIDRIQLPQGINEGPITLTPRPGGGFDLSIQVPDQ
ncbi:hypothetical protein GCM10011533_26200 [Streptosporangium jomthongense]|uniref:Uncharacterized protein n=1 Tax=Marinobacter aromaticivorans TaxID=1494078 RepID=A0ABW2IXR2_9GAMM|nr:hypothetical protein [Marinobacter aromaticivorans]GGE72575.1 hypothetical protein GCM10011533_26200 [Streptosporangium jomthongense]